MRYGFSAPAAVLAFLLLGACGQQTTRPTSEPTAESATFKYLNTMVGQRGIVSPQDQLVILDSTQDQIGQTHVRLQQVHRGIPVYASHLIVHLNSDLSGRALTGDLVLIPADTATTSVIGEAKARETALDADCADETEGVQLVFYSPTNQTPQLAWRVSASQGLMLCDVFVSAAEPRLLGIVNRSPSSKR